MILSFNYKERHELLSIGKSLNKIAQETLNIENRALGTSKDLSKLPKTIKDCKKY